VVEALSTPESDSAIVAGGQAVMLGSMLEEAPNHQLSQR
jgi:hypothetical protein